MTTAQDEIDIALAELKALVRKAVREEQLRDGLTSLANNGTRIQRPPALSGPSKGA